MIVLLSLVSLAGSPANASPTVTVISPKAGIVAGSPVFYEAYATSPTCAAGISAMRIYSGPGVTAYTVSGAHIEQFIPLTAGTYSTVVQAWDNCGGVAKATVDLTVTSNAGISVFLPDQTSSEWPVHFAASAQNPSCSKGISALRIYTASGVTPYTINSNKLDAYVNLRPATYTFTVAAWDNCGHTFKSQLSEVVTAGQDAYLYGAADFDTAGVYGIGELKINSNGTVTNPNGAATLPIFHTQSAPNTIAVDPGGWFVYATSKLGIYGFQINRANGALAEMPGSPFAFNQPLGTGDAPPSIVMDPAGNFLYLAYTGGFGALATYRIHRSGGTLTWTGWSCTVESAGCGVAAPVVTDFTGQYLYFDAAIMPCTYSCSTGTYAFKTDPNHGFLKTEVEGSPYASEGQPVSTGPYLYSVLYGNVSGFSIAPGTGALSELAGSPFSFSGMLVSPPPAFFADWKQRSLWVWEGNGIQTLIIDPMNGALTAGSFAKFPAENVFDLVQDHSGGFLFTTVLPSLGGTPSRPTGPEDVTAWAISSKGSLTKLNAVPVSPTWGNFLSTLAVARKNPI